MKKIFSYFYATLFVLAMMAGHVHAYSSDDTDNAYFLAEKWIIAIRNSPQAFRLDDTITRAELLWIALKMKGEKLPENYTCKNYFSDVKYDTKNNWICRAIEISADNNLISKANKKFRPQDPITRAEAIAILWNANGLDVEQENYNSWDVKILGKSEWAKPYFYTGFKKWLFTYFYNDSNKIYDFQIDRFASRAEIIKLARSIYHAQNGLTLQYQWIYSYFNRNPSFSGNYPFIPTGFNDPGADNYELVTNDLRSFVIPKNIIDWMEPKNIAPNYAIPDDKNEWAYFSVGYCDELYMTGSSLETACDSIKNTIYYIDFETKKIKEIFSQKNKRDTTQPFMNPFPNLGELNGYSPEWEKTMKKSWEVAYTINYKPEKKWHAHFWQLLYRDGNKLIINPDIYKVDYVCDSPLNYRKSLGDFGLAEDILSLDLSQWADATISWYIPSREIQQQQIEYLKWIEGYLCTSESIHYFD